MPPTHVSLSLAVDAILTTLRKISLHESLGPFNFKFNVDNLIR